MIPGEAASLGSLDAINSGNYLRDLSLKFLSDLSLKVSCNNADLHLDKLSCDLRLFVITRNSRRI